MVEDNVNIENTPPVENPAQPKFNLRKGVLIGLVVLVSLLLILLPMGTNKITQRDAHISVSPTPKPDFSKYELINGSLYKVLSDGGKELFIDKASLKDPQLEISRIYDFKLSPDKSKILLLAEGGITPFLLYYKDLANGKIISIDFGEETAWSPNSRYVTYTRGMADAGPRSVYVFDTILNKDTELDEPKTKYYASYDNIGWKPDSSAIIANYQIHDGIPYGNLIDKGKTEIKLKIIK